jgi:hypothetical protein
MGTLMSVSNAIRSMMNLSNAVRSLMSVSNSIRLHNYLNTVIGDLSFTIADLYCKQVSNPRFSL